ncbi:MAG: hypothetical protein V4662_09225 [Verrucomicrobiota bacterium]
MPLAFSFFNSKRSPAPKPEAVAEVTSSAQTPDSQGEGLFRSSLPKSPFPMHDGPDMLATLPQPEAPSAKDSETPPTLILPKLSSQADPLPSSSAPPESAGIFLPEKNSGHRGLAAMVVHQSEKAAPPLNRRPLTSPFPTQTAENLVAMSFQEAIQTASIVPPPSGSLSSVAQISSAETGGVSLLSSPLSSFPGDPVRHELQEEIEQVKNDLFGAVMGVSALKDRLDGLEAQLQRIQSAPPAAPVPASADPTPTPGASRSEVEGLISSWMETNLSTAVERLLAASREQMMASLSTLSFFRTATPLSGTDRQSFLAQPPVILTATPV